MIKFNKPSSEKYKSDIEKNDFEKNLAYFMGVLYEMRENGELEKEAPIPHPPVKGIVLQGGGVKGLAYLGALEEMEKIGALEEAEFVCGSSAGAINALLIATGLSADQIKQYCMDFDTRNLMDARESSLGEYLAGGIGPILKSLIQTMGAYGEAKTAREFLRNILLHLTGDADVTFAELEEMRKINPSIKEFLCTATLLPENGMAAGEARLFSHRTSPDVLVADAVLASMSLPGIWSPVTVRKKMYLPNYNIQFKDIGTYSDGGIHNNLPVDVANKFVRDNEYLMIPRYAKNAYVWDNPCVLSLSLCNANQLNEAICPIPVEVKNQAVGNDQNNEPCFHIDNVNKAKQDLKKYRPLPITSFVNPENKKYRRVSVHQKAQPSDARRLFNIIVANQVEDIVEKNMQHNEGTILLYDNGISAANLGLSEQKKDELIMIGSKTTQQYFLKKRNPTKEYPHRQLYQIENLDLLDNDVKRNEKLDTLCMALVKEFEKYIQPGAKSRGYSWPSMKNNIKIKNLYWKIYKILNMLEIKPNDFDGFMYIKLNEAYFEKIKKEDFGREINDNLYKKLNDLSVIKNDLMALIKKKPFDKQEFITRFAALGAKVIIQLSDKHRILLLTAALSNPDALNIMLTHIEKSYISLHQVPSIAVGMLGETRMEYAESKRAFKRLVNMTFKNKPLIFHCIDANQPESVKALLQHHVDQHVLYNGKSIFQYAVDTGKTECFLKACPTKTFENGYRLGMWELKKNEPFGKIITYGYQAMRNLAYVLFNNTDSAIFKRSLMRLRKPENDIWEEFKKLPLLNTVVHEENGVRSNLAM